MYPRLCIIPVLRLSDIIMKHNLANLYMSFLTSYSDTSLWGIYLVLENLGNLDDLPSDPAPSACPRPAVSSAPRINHIGGWGGGGSMCISYHITIFISLTPNSHIPYGINVQNPDRESDVPGRNLMSDLLARAQRSSSRARARKNGSTQISRFFWFG
jgi:hypothetical protein